MKPVRYLSSQACIDCHEEQFDAWSESHHSWAWRKPTAENVLADFKHTQFEYAGFSYEFSSKNGTYLVEADGPDGRSTLFQVKYVVGVSPLQQYLVETEEGRLQALDVAWDIVKNRWFHLYPELEDSPDPGLHWSGSYKNWNSRCAECHATNYRKNYLPSENKYNSQQSEIGVGCEACHGPGESHVEWARSKENFDSGKWQDIENFGLTGITISGSADSEINLCAGCHSRRESLTGESPPPGSMFGDFYRLATLQDGLYFPDGQIKDEVYVYGSFIQSKMYAKGVRCTDCHDAHTYRLKAQGNRVCTQCHSQDGNPDFPSLRKADYDESTHHFHQPGSTGAECKNCHMPERRYMQIDGRRDHSFRIPDPKLSERLKSPDPCILCHQDKSASWAARYMETWYTPGQRQVNHYGNIFAQADRQLTKATLHRLLEIAADKEVAPMVRASAIHRMTQASASIDKSRLAALLFDENALIRVAAVSLYGAWYGEESMQDLLPLLSDRLRAVRIEVARVLSALPVAQTPEKARQGILDATEEFQRSLAAKADFPETQMVIGGVALSRREFSVAVKSFEKAVQMDPQLIQAWIMLAKIQAALAGRDAAFDTLKSAIQANPENHELRQIADSLGLSTSESSP